MLLYTEGWSSGNHFGQMGRAPVYSVYKAASAVDLLAL